MNKNKLEYIKKWNKENIRVCSISKKILDRYPNKTVRQIIEAYEEQMKKFKAIVEANNLGHFFK